MNCNFHCKRGSLKIPDNTSFLKYHMNKKPRSDIEALSPASSARNPCFCCEFRKHAKLCHVKFNFFCMLLVDGLGVLLDAHAGIERIFVVRHC